MIDKIIFGLLALVVAAVVAVYFSPNYILIETDQTGRVVGSTIIFPLGKHSCEEYIKDLGAFGPRGTHMTCVLIKNHRIAEKTGS